MFFFIVSLQDDEGLRANLTLAIAHCSEWGENNYKFGKLNAVAPLVNYMTSKNKNILRGVCIAAYHLSKEPSNCVTMHSSGVIKVRYSNSVIFLLYYNIVNRNFVYPDIVNILYLMIIYLSSSDFKLLLKNLVCACMSFPVE